jgi:hypothetical protein
VDADDVETLAADVLELVRRLCAYDQEIAGTGLDLLNRPP